MPSKLEILRMRYDRRQRARRSAEERSLRIGIGFGFLGSGLIVLLILAATMTYASLTRDLPPIEQLPILLNPQSGQLLEPTRLYDRSGGQLLLTLAPQDSQRGYILYDQIPQALVDATLALADPGFWEHAGYSIEGWQEPDQHPTLAQKLVADLLLWDEPPSTRRALRERLLAAQVTARYGREQVLEWVLNSLDFGNYAYGVEAAAQLYLGKSATELDLSEAALLAGVSQAPALNPLDAPQAAEQRRLETLQVMLAMGLIAEIPSSPVNLSVGEVDQGNEFEAFTSIVLSQLGERLGRDRLARGGLVVRTTLDISLQRQVECAIHEQLVRLGSAQPDGSTAGETPCEAARFLTSFLPEQVFESLSASALVLDPASGQVLAAAGEGGNGQGVAYQSSHPAGSLLTPFIYLTSFTRGLGPASLGWDIPGQVENLDGEYHGPVRLRMALVNDYLPPAAALLEQMGPDSVRRTAGSFGLDQAPDADLLSEDVTMLEVAQAYSVFAAEGALVGQALSASSFRPVTVLEVSTIDHASLLNWKQSERRLLVSAQLAYLMNHVLSDQVARYPSLGRPNPLEIGRPAGAKLGQTTDGHDAWVAGYTPQRVVVTWMGSGQEALPSAAVAGLWSALIQFSSQGSPTQGWEMPPGVTRMEVCDPSGLLVTQDCPNVVSEVFITGNEPTQADTLFQAFEINRETGYLATVFTPPEMIEERVYMLVPPEAQAWAEATGIPAPPTSFDTLQVQAVDPDVHITSPGLFAEVSGVVEITGTARGTDFASCHLEYGQGLNPQKWFRIGQDGTRAVDEGLLSEWDTSGLDGLYAIRLVVIQKDRLLQRAVTLVTVKNP